MIYAFCFNVGHFGTRRGRAVKKRFSFTRDDGRCRHLRRQRAKALPDE